MIKFENISIAHKGASPLLENQSCFIPSGTLIALTGRNGSGKSTLLRAICGTQQLQSGKILLGPELIDPSKVTAGKLAELLSVVTSGRVHVRNMTVRQMVEMGRAPMTGLFALLHHDDNEAVERALESVGLERFANREISGLSDGEFQRLMLARALAQDTRIILLDEPTGFLDVPNRRSVTRLLAELAHNQGKTILYSTHELELALDCADLMLHLSPPELALLPPVQMRVYPPLVDMQK